ncbi:MAG: Gldg family protein [Planctomycetes bacterium]|nr:Gldg family protein [Planctomycetota bacterium]
MKQRRRYKLGLITTLASLGGIALILLCLQTLASPKFRTRWDLTSQGKVGLSERTVDALAQLPKGSRAVAFLLFKENRQLLQNGAQVYPKAYGRLRVLLEDARIRSGGKLEVSILEEFSSPVEIATTLQEFERQPLEVLAIQTPTGQRRKFLFDELFVTLPPSPDGAPARLVQERIDSVLGDAAIRLASGKTLRAGIVTGYGQPFVDREQGLLPFLRVLQSEGVDAIAVEGPAQALAQNLDLLVVPGQRKSFLDADANALRQWLQAGKPLFLALGPTAPPELVASWNQSLADHGIQFGPGMICEARPEYRVYPGTSAVATLELADHQFSGQHTATMRLSEAGRPQGVVAVRPLELVGGNNDYSRVSLARSGEKAWVDLDQDFAPGPGETIGIKNIAAAAELWEGTDPSASGRVILFGSAVTLTGRHLPGIHEFLGAGLRWLIGQDETPGGLVALKSLPFRPTRSTQLRITNLAILGIPGFTLLLALLIFWRRRS